jgi:uncharacterized protein (TIGR02246 family)
MAKIRPSPMNDTISAEDKLAIMQLIADYAYMLDSGDLDGYVNNFAPDGVFEPRSGYFRHEGREAIRKYVGYLMEIGQAGPSGVRMHHFMGIPSIHGDSEHAHAETYLVVLGQLESNPVEVPMVDLYIDDLVKIDGRWHFQKRYVRLDLLGPQLGRRDDI